MTTLGEYRVGIDFNPSADPRVTAIKRTAADLIDLIDHQRPVDNDEVVRLKALAIDAVEAAAMWAVKMVTKPVRD